MSNIFGSGKFQQIGGKSTFRKYDDWAPGDQIAGEVVQVAKDKFGKPAYVIKVSDVQFAKLSDVPAIGSLFTLNSAGGLQYKVDQVGGVEAGDTIGVEYNGKAEVLKGKWAGKACHDIEFYIQKAGVAIAPTAQESNDDLV